MTKNCETFSFLPHSKWKSLRLPQGHPSAKGCWQWGSVCGHAFAGLCLFRGPSHPCSFCCVLQEDPFKMNYTSTSQSPISFCLPHPFSPSANPQYLLQLSLFDVSSSNIPYSCHLPVKSVCTTLACNSKYWFLGIPHFPAFSLGKWTCLKLSVSLS